MYAVIETGGKQYRVSEGQCLRVERLNEEPGTQILIDKVLLVGKDEEILVGTPNVEGAVVAATVLGHGKEKKVIVFKYRRKKNYRRFRGHRQPYSEVRIDEIRA